jgi:hypothetical protein
MLSGVCGGGYGRGVKEWEWLLDVLVGAYLWLGFGWARHFGGGVCFADMVNIGITICLITNINLILVSYEFLFLIKIK